MTANVYRLGIDFGTSTTVAVLSIPGRLAGPLLFESSPLLSSAVAAATGPVVDTASVLLTGGDAERAAAASPASFEANPKRRIDEGWCGSANVRSRWWSSSPRCCAGSALRRTGAGLVAVPVALLDATGDRMVTRSADGTAKIWDYSSRSPITTLTCGSSAVSTAALAPDGGTAALACANHNDVQLWSAGGKLITVLPGHTDYVNDVAFAADGRTLASASTDGTIRLWQFPRPS
ncbi:WD40 repeat domain-containing protein [Dactylosporangium sp. CA-052675]|uniref:WD40 repeat domain-containing protein n=1 Tax=Dactylosporangium sp. CA-052675 TaxID=3239927 RepID=UPI003D8B576D